MWRDICITNQAALSRELKLYRKHLEELQAALDQKDAKALEACFDNASRHRRSLVFPK
jgi:prephenate dehydrogenase